MNLTEFFTASGIELFASVDFHNVRIIDHRKLDRYHDFSPKSVLIMALPYFIGMPHEKNISNYAVPKDYHLFFKDFSKELLKVLSELYPNNRFIPFADSSPIDERHAAAISGLGVIGKNKLLITKKYGSYVFLGEVLSDLECDRYFGQAPEVHPVGSCIGCNACLGHCPREKIGLCLSELTQKKGLLTDDETDFLREYKTVWGCDICQSICPHNRHIEITPIEFFKENTIDYLDRELVENMPKEEFLKRAWAWRGRNTILRNLDIYDKGRKNDTQV